MKQIFKENSLKALNQLNIKLTQYRPFQDHIGCPFGTNYYYYFENSLVKLKRCIGLIFHHSNNMFMLLLKSKYDLNKPLI